MTEKAWLNDVELHELEQALKGGGEVPRETLLAVVRGHRRALASLGDVSVAHTTEAELREHLVRRAVRLRLALADLAAVKRAHTGSAKDVARRVRDRARRALALDLEDDEEMMEETGCELADLV